MNAQACEADLARAREEILALEVKLQHAERQRDLAESRGWRWLNHAISCDDAVVAMIEHIESEIKLKRGNAAHRRILDRLAELHEAFP